MHFSPLTYLTKKTLFSKERESERVTKLRVDYKAQQPSLDVKNLIFIDESGYRLGSCKRYGWSEKGVRALGFTDDKGGWQTMTMIGAMSLRDICSFMTIDSGTSAPVFSAFVEHYLVPVLTPGDIVVMDNLSAHKNVTTIEKIKEIISLL